MYIADQLVGNRPVTMRVPAEGEAMVRRSWFAKSQHQAAVARFLQPGMLRLHHLAAGGNHGVEASDGVCVVYVVVGVMCDKSSSAAEKKVASSGKKVRFTEDLE